MTTIIINWKVVYFIMELVVILGSVFMVYLFSTQQRKNSEARTAWLIIFLYALGNAKDCYEILFK